MRRIDAAARARHGTTEVASVAATITPLAGASLTVSALSKAFGGNQALSEVSLTAAPGAVTALIGPNGSGKTTLLNMISGFYQADSGTVELGGEQIQGSSSYSVARSGVSRTFQTPNVPAKLSVIDVVESGYYATNRASLLASILRLPSFWRTKRTSQHEAQRVLALVGLTAQQHELADSLPLGNRRLLEVARCLVSSPRVLLLDEVASGLDEDEIEVLATLIQRLSAAGQTVVLVEHNFQLVLRLADDIYVLAQGKVMAHGSSAEIEHDPRVREEYLGIRAEEFATGGSDE
ncbi:ABC transporter ATP-binding protein [Glaciibacter psychrotolerans]